MKMPIKTIVLSVSMACLSSLAMADTQIVVDTNLTNTLATIAKQGADGSTLNLAINTGDVNASVNTAGEGFDLSKSHHGFQVDAQSMNQLQGDIKTMALGASNNGTINLQQGSSVVTNAVTLDGSFKASMAGNKSYASTETTQETSLEAAAAQASGGQSSSSSEEEDGGYHHGSSASEEASSSGGSFSGWYLNATNYYNTASEAFNAALAAGVEAEISTSNISTAASTASNYAAANVAFNSGDINASVNTTGFTNTLGNIETTAVGAVNTGAITVTVK